FEVHHGLAGRDGHVAIDDGALGDGNGTRIERTLDARRGTQLQLLRDHHRTLDFTGDDRVCGADLALPVATFGQGERAAHVAVTRHAAPDHQIPFAFQVASESRT